MKVSTVKSLVLIAVLDTLYIINYNYFFKFQDDVVMILLWLYVWLIRSILDCPRLCNTFTLYSNVGIEIHTIHFYFLVNNHILWTVFFNSQLSEHGHICKMYTCWLLQYCDQTIDIRLNSYITYYILYIFYFTSALFHSNEYKY